MERRQKKDVNHEGKDRQACRQEGQGSCEEGSSEEEEEVI
jgi:hypothetical protein